MSLKSTLSQEGMTSNGGYRPSINNYGDILYTRITGDFDGMAVYNLGGGRLTSFNVRKDVNVMQDVNVNDYGDFVFVVASKKAHQVVLATQRPQFYPQYTLFDPLNLISGPRINLDPKSREKISLSGLVGQNYRIEFTTTLPQERRTPGIHSRI
jgi:hypothetical protein